MDEVQSRVGPVRVRCNPLTGCVARWMPEARPVRQDIRASRSRRGDLDGASGVLHRRDDAIRLAERRVVVRAPRERKFPEIVAVERERVDAVLHAGRRRRCEEPVGPVKLQMHDAARRERDRCFARRQVQPYAAHAAAGHVRLAEQVAPIRAQSIRRDVCGVVDASEFLRLRNFPLQAASGPERYAHDPVAQAGVDPFRVWRDRRPRTTFDEERHVRAIGVDAPHVHRAVASEFPRAEVEERLIVGSDPLAVAVLVVVHDRERRELHDLDAGHVVDSELALLHELRHVARILRSAAVAGVGDICTDCRDTGEGQSPLPQR